MKTPEILSKHFLENQTFNYKGKECIIVHILDIYGYQFFLKEIVSGVEHQNVSPRAIKNTVTAGNWRAKVHADEQLKTLNPELLSDINTKVKTFNKQK
jgi:hypothetical protein